MRRLTLLATLLPLALVAAGCLRSQDGEDREKTAALMKEMRAQVGLPNITNFTEAKFARQIAELRDQSIKTWTYYVDLNGGRHLLCESVGYALPYSVQLTNPERYVYEGATIPQAEPNGLFMPESAEASWVMCSDGKGSVAPVYSEPRLLVSPFPLGHVEAAQSSGFDDTVTMQKLGAISIQGAAEASTVPPG